MSVSEEPRSVWDQMQEGITDIALVLLKEHPPGTPVRFETEVLPAESDQQAE